MASEISDLFKTVDDKIINGANNTIPVNDINNLFRTIAHLISDKEPDLKRDYYNRVKHEFHMKKSSFLRLIGKIDEAVKEEELVGRYEEELPSSRQDIIDDSNDNCVLASCSTTLQTLPESDFEKIKTDVLDMWNQLKDYIKDCQLGSTVNDLDDLINIFNVSEVNLFDQYMKLEELSSKIRFILNLLKSQIFSSDNKSDKTIKSNVQLSNTWNDELLKFIVKLDLIVFNCLYEYRCNFGQFLLSQKHRLNDFLFDNIPFTEERINAHARKLAGLFHPDKIQRPQDIANFRELFECIIIVRNNFLNDLTQRATINGLVAMHKEKGYEFWIIARDYSRAKNEKWDELCHFKEDQLKQFTKNELLTHQKQFALCAYEEYRAAALALGDHGNIEERSELRRLMAIALYTAERYLPAQTYVIAAMHILLNDIPSDNYSKKFDELKELLNKVSQNTSSTKTSNGNSKAIINQTTTDRSIIANNQSTHTLIQKRAYLKDELKSIVLQQCLFRSEEKEIKTSEELILHAKRQAFKHKNKGIILGASGVAVGSSMLVSTYNSIIIGAEFGATFGPLGIVVGIIAGVSVGAGSLLLGHNLIKQSQEQFKEPRIRENLNKIFNQALEYYKEGNYTGFLELLATKYSKDRSLLTIKIDEQEHEIRVEVKAKEIVKILLKHDFRPDGTAYLLILIGEALLKRPQFRKDKTNFCQPTQSLLNEYASQLFSEVFQATSLLQVKAKELDDKVKKKQLERAEARTAILSNYWWEIMALHSSYTDSIPKEYFSDALNTPFSSRLEELGMIARLNCAIVQIIIGSSDNLKRTSSYIIS
ncbi:unnamed protein product [Adineta steineri]|uniref:J domain-containing protein n=1 Tax=Adineta steineri TaxID=433720 RepID=A0A814PII5_9BILA|nr:unnamed protein product [Adineta steineri]CAF1102028.1 unnamed protein product [Adineta steineri]CAF1105942.1 unnamed protein product [Adineta steineri]